MKNGSRVRFPKKGKKNVESKRQLITQNDYYEEATVYEEQAERWLLSDIKKSLRFYIEAFRLYENSLIQGQEPTEKGTYDIYYNETRLLLQIYTDYMANEGYINILQYVNLNDIPNVNNILKSLPEIVEKLEFVYNKFVHTNNDLWDLEFNLLTSYLSLLESNETYSIYGENVLELANKFIELAQALIKKQIQELETWQNVITNHDTNNNSYANLIRDTLDEDDSNKNSVHDGSGIITHSTNSNDKNEETMEVSDQITQETLSEVLVDCYKFVEVILEILTQSKLAINGSENNNMNIVQINYLEDLVEKFYLQLNDIISTGLNNIQFDFENLEVAMCTVEGYRTIVQGNLEALKEYIEMEVKTKNEENYLNIQFVKIDTLDFAIECLTNHDNKIEWELSSTLNKKLTEVRTSLTAVRNDILTTGKFDQKKNNRLSPIVFQLCNIYVSTADNELRRWIIKRDEGTDEALKVCEILLKNSKTLLSNAQKIAEKSCGMQETIVDKLRRNYIFNQSKSRLAMLATQERVEPISTILNNGTVTQDSVIEDLLKDHPFYSQLK